MKTKIRHVPDNALFGARALVAKLMPYLQWRHSGLGMLQAYVTEGPTDELRVHVWDERLRRPGIEESGLLHDHRFDMESTVLLGSIHQIEYNLEAVELRPEHGIKDHDRYVLHEVVHARKAFAEGRTHDGGVSELPGDYIVHTAVTRIDPGGAYTFPARSFHGSYHDGTTITIVRKSNQRDIPARILAPKGKPVVHAFADTFSPEHHVVRTVLHEAQAKLVDALHKVKP